MCFCSSVKILLVGRIRFSNIEKFCSSTEMVLGYLLKSWDGLGRIPVEEPQQVGSCTHSYCCGSVYHADKSCSAAELAVL